MSEANNLNLEEVVRTIPDFPEPGIQFKDITPILADPVLLVKTVEVLAEPFRDQGITKVIGIESRGFIFGPMLAERLRAGFVPMRKAGKLPAATFSQTYDLEYGTATIEMHQDALSPEDRVLIHDDVLATGGTARAAAQLIARTGASVAAFAFLIELDFLKGRSVLDGATIHTLLHC